MISLLEARGVLSQPAGRSLHEFVATVARAGAQPAGSAADPVLPPDLEAQAKTVLMQLSELCTRAPARFEELVLSTLGAIVAPDWGIRLDVPVQGHAFVTDQPAGAEFSARVDAVVTRDGHDVIVEVRPRLDLAATEQVDAVNAWLATLPNGVPVVLVVLTDTIGLQQLGIAQGNPVQILNWDRERDALRATVERSL